MNLAYKRNLMNESVDGYGRVYKSVLQRKDISRDAKAIYALLSTYCGAKDYCNPSLNTISEDLVCCKNTALKGIEELRSIGCLMIKKIKNSNNEYHLKQSLGGSCGEPGVVHEMNQGGSCGEPGVVHEMNSKKNIQEEQLRRTIKKKEKVKKESSGKKGKNLSLEVWPTFDDFWDAYDKKVGKLAAQAQWKKIKQDDREKIMQHVESYKAANEKRFRKDPERYLNKKKWEDEVVFSSQKDSITGSRLVDGHLEQMEYYYEVTGQTPPRHE